MQERKISTVKKVLLIILAVVILALSFFGGYLTYHLSLSEKQRTVNWLIGMIEDNYVYYDTETGELKEFTAKDYADAITSGLLDIYSEYYTKTEYTDVIKSSTGDSYGTGLSFLIGGDLTIFDVAGNSPALKSGIKAGGLITAVEYDGVKTAVKTFDDLSNAFAKIPPYTEFKLYIEYNGVEGVYLVSKEEYVETFVFYSDKTSSYEFVTDETGELVLTENGTGLSNLDGQTAYVRYTSFMYGSETQLESVFDKARTDGKTKLILDLRDNGGGYMDVLTDVAELFIDEGGKAKNLIAVARNKNGKEEKFYTSENRFAGFESVVVLANKNSASASEALIGALTHYGVVSSETLVITKYGEVAKTYGKGIMQTTYPHILVWDAVKLTTAYIYFPDGKTSIHNKGFIATGENAVSPSVDKTTDNELLRAIEILK